MQAVHEPEALPGLSARADPDTQSPTVAHDDDVFSALTLEERPWKESATAGTPSVEAPPSEQDLNAADSETDNVVAQYLGEVRQFALLSFAEEQALARRITRGQRRVRWALYTAPMALPTLRRLWHQVEHEEIPVHEVVQARESATPDPAAHGEAFQHTLVHLQDIAMHLRRLDTHRETLLWTAQARRERRHEAFRLWRAWLRACESLRLHPRVHEALGEALEAAWRTQPEAPALQAAYRAWIRTQRALEEAKAQMMQANLRLVIHIALRFSTVACLCST